MSEYVPAYRKASPFKVEDAKEVLFETADILDACGVEFFLVFGTCLGAVREQRLISWDYDIDLGFYDTERLGELREIFRGKGYEIKNRGRSEYAYLPMIRRGVLVDIHPFTKEEEKMVTYSMPWEAWLSFPAHFGTLQHAIMYDRTFLTPSPAEEYLEWTYGDWRTPSDLSATQRR